MKLLLIKEINFPPGPGATAHLVRWSKEIESSVVPERGQSVFIGSRSFHMETVGPMFEIEQIVHGGGSLSTAFLTDTDLKDFDEYWDLESELEQGDWKIEFDSRVKEPKYSEINLD